MISEDLGRQKDYIGCKFLIEDYKSILNNIMHTSNLLKNFGVSSSLRDTISKSYYDTEDMFFRSKGLSISINIYKSRPYADLVIRYESDVKRIQFLSDIPDTFIKKINKRDKIYNYSEYIAKVILELCPNGIDVDALEMVRKLKLILEINKKRDRYRVINSNGLKIILSFEQCVFENNKKQKVKLNTLELRLDSSAETGDLFNEFVHKMQLSEYRLISIKTSDLYIGQEYLDI